MIKIQPSASHKFIGGELPLVRRGKVRDLYRLNDNLLLSVVTDRGSIFDIVLPATFQYKGYILNLLNIFWRWSLIPRDLPQDLVGCGPEIDYYLPRELRGNRDLQMRSTVIRLVDIIPMEAIVRGYLTGSALKQYQITSPWHNLWGHDVPPGLQDGSELPRPLFTPTTKAETGHDLPIYINTARRAPHLPQIEKLSLEIYRRMCEHAYNRGIILADAKFEFGLLGGDIVLADEIGTPDSCRFWDIAECERALRENRSPQPLDKQFLRNWGKSVDFDRLNPAKDEDIERAHALHVPAEVCYKTMEFYHEIQERLTGCDLETAQARFLV